MPVEVVHVYSIVEGVLVSAGRGRSVESMQGNVVGPLTNLPAHPSDDGPILAIEIGFRDKGERHTITMPLARFMSAAEYSRSFDAPLSFGELDQVKAGVFEQKLLVSFRSVWLFRDGIYSTLRPPQGGEGEEVILRIKSLRFQEDESLRRLREQVANFEAIESNSKSQTVRKPIADDVKLLVWSRDGGACIKCGAKTNLHFDHIIPLSRGGGDHGDNIQLLCRTCNLAKSDRIV